MSTYWYFECMNHTPPIGSEEFTQHTDDAAFHKGIELALARPLTSDLNDVEYGYFERNTRIFLFAHPDCRLEIVNEYGDRRALKAEAPIERTS